MSHSFVSTVHFLTPPLVHKQPGFVRITIGGVVLAETDRAWSITDSEGNTFHYVPCEDLLLNCLRQTRKRTLCEWKGKATYFDIIVEGSRIQNAAWSYYHPKAGFDVIRNHIALDPSLVESCRIDCESDYGMAAS